MCTFSVFCTSYIFFHTEKCIYFPALHNVTIYWNRELQLISLCEHYYQIWIILEQVCKIIALVLPTCNKVNIVNILQCLAVDSILNWRHVQTSNYDNVNALRIRFQSFTEDWHGILPFAKICINVSWLVVSLMYVWTNHILHISRVYYKCISTFNNMCYKIQRHCTILYNMYIVY